MDAEKREKMRRFVEANGHGPELPQYWDEYWRLHEGDQAMKHELFGFFDFRQLDALRSMPVRSVLFAGNGVSQYPRWFAHAGLVVTALDISPVATRIAAGFELEPRHLTVRYGRLSNGRVEPQEWCVTHHPGGTVEFVTGDLRDEAVCPGPFDVIYCDRVLQNYSDAALDDMVERLVRRMTPGALLVASVLNGEAARQSIEASLDRHAVRRVERVGDGHGAQRTAFLRSGSG